MNLSKLNKKICKNIIWIIGPQRSGTSLTGKILGSMKEVEYFYEPELLFSLMPSINKIDKKIWSILFETYVVEDLFFNNLTGRKINLKKFEESYIGNYLSKKNINTRLSSLLKKKNLSKKLNKTKIVIKIPDCIKYFHQYQKIYKKNKFIILRRDIFENLRSLVKKNWYDNLGYTNEIYPFIKDKKNYYPIWIEKKHKKLWNSFNKYEKAAFYLIENYNYQNKIKNKLTINYEQIVKNPNKILKLFEKNLKVTQTDLTKKNIKMKKRKKETKKSNINFLKNRINNKMFSKLLYINDNL